MAKKFRYDVLAGPFDYWAVADAWKSGWNTAKGLKWNDPKAAMYKLPRDLHDGYINGNVGQSGFFVVVKVVLTKEQLAAIDEKKHKKELEMANMELKLAMERVAKLNVK